MSKHNSHAQLLSISLLATPFISQTHGHLPTHDFYIGTKLRSFLDIFWLPFGVGGGVPSALENTSDHIDNIESSSPAQYSAPACPLQWNRCKKSNHYILLSHRGCFFCSLRQQMVLSKCLNTLYTFLSLCSFCHLLSIFSPARLFVLMVSDEFLRLIMHHVRKYFTCITFKFISF